MPQRYVESRIDAVERTQSGALRVTASPTRVGVFTYTRLDGSTVRELRSPEQVFAPESLASLEDVAVTINHPPGGRVTPANHRAAAAGHVRAGTVRADEAAGVVRAGLVLARQDAIDMASVSADKRPEISCGYDCLIDPTPGVWNGERYDQQQIRIRYHHAAMLAPGLGRMGSTCRLDGAGEQIPDEGEAPSSETTIMKITIGGKTYENETEAQAAVTELQARADASAAQVGTLTTAVAQRDAEKAQTEHAALVAQVKGIMGPDFVAARKDAAGAEIPLSTRELHCAVISRCDSTFNPNAAGCDDSYVRARFDLAVKGSARATEVVQALNGNGSPAPGVTRTDSAPNRAEARMKQHLETARKNGASLTE